MKFSTRVVVLFYVILVMFISTVILMVSLRMLDYGLVSTLVYHIYNDKDLRLVITIWIGIVLFLNFIFYRLLVGNAYVEKTIAFDNPSGRVSVSLVALEDLIKRILARLSEIKESKPDVTATKRGLQVRIKITLRSEANIPDLTSRVQDLVKRKIQDMIGIDEPISVTIYVSKIMLDGDKDKRSEKSIMEEKPTTVPFHGYRA